MFKAPLAHHLAKSIDFVFRDFGIRLVRRENRKGFKAGAINDMLPSLSEPYIALLDADQRPLTTWLRDIVPLLEENPKLAFVQVPQIYVNGAGLPVAASRAIMPPLMPA